MIACSALLAAGEILGNVLLPVQISVGTPCDLYGVGSVDVLAGDEVV
jgi:hypothetical protein